jgi:hypothetical protein
MHEMIKFHLSRYNIKTWWPMAFSDSSAVAGHSNLDDQHVMYGVWQRIGRDLEDQLRQLYSCFSGV